MTPIQEDSTMDNGASSYRRFLGGDKAAFDEIMKELFTGLVFFIDRYVRNLHTAQDIAIDVFSDLIAYPNRYNFRVSLKTYLYMLGRSRALDHLRRQKHIRFVELSEADMLADEHNDLEQQLLADEQKQAVNAAIAKLPQDMQAAVHLVYFEQMSYQEAARVMKKNHKQVDNLLYRAKKELRIILGEDGEYSI